MDSLAQAAVADVAAGMTVGLGTGRAAARCVRALAARVHAERLAITCVCTSRSTEDLAAELGLRVVDAGTVGEIDYLFDGADEVDPHLAMIKGGGGAMTRERIVASMVRSGGARVYTIDDAKLTPHLGMRSRLPVEIIPTAAAVVERHLASIGLNGQWRQRSLSGSTSTTDYLTDNGNRVLDVDLLKPVAADESDLASLALQIDTIPGVVDHGLFLTECLTLLIQKPDGRIERRTRDHRS